MTSVAAASTIQQTQVANRIDAAVAKKSLDVQASQGRAAVELVKQAAEVQRQVFDAHLDMQM